MKTKNYVITSGKFTDAGNFTGYNALGERLHIHKRQMEALKWEKDADVKTPFYAIGAEKEIGQLDAEGNPLMAEGVPVLVTRLTALSIFKTKAELINAHVDANMLDVEIAQEFTTQATTAGLNEEAVKALLSATF